MTRSAVVHERDRGSKVMIAEEIPRRQQALGRLPALLAAWVKANKAMLVVPPDSFVARAVVADEIKQFQGFDIPFEEVEYAHYYESELDDEPIVLSSRGIPTRETRHLPSGRQTTSPADRKSPPPGLA